MAWTMRAVPTSNDVAAYLGLDPIADPDDSSLALIVGRLPVVLTLAASYTRGVGFSEDGTQCAPDLWATVVAATARLASAEVPGERRAEVGSTSWYNDGTAESWVLRETLALRNYRRLSA